MRINHNTPPEILIAGARINAEGKMSVGDYMGLRVCGHLLELSHEAVRKGKVTAADYWQAITKLPEVE